eukprot:5855754-Pleurochrysis_carterae.AAC.1
MLGAMLSKVGGSVRNLWSVLSASSDRPFVMDPHRPSPFNLKAAVGINGERSNAEVRCGTIKHFGQRMHPVRG